MVDIDIKNYINRTYERDKIAWDLSSHRYFRETKNMLMYFHKLWQSKYYDPKQVKGSKIYKDQSSGIPTLHIGFEL
jgi:hypothetical protein